MPQQKEQMSNPFDRNKNSNSHEARLGHFIGPDAVVNQRDAVHIAVAPVIAGDDLSPGRDLAILRDGVTAVFAGNNGEGAVGIADPFLKGWNIPKGTRFWMFLYQGSVTTLRHEWTHPSFPDPTTSAPKKDEVSPSQIQEAENWLRTYAARVNYYLGPEGAFEQLIADLRDGRITYHGTDMHSRDELIDADDLRLYASIYLKRPINFDDFEYFSCTC